MKYRKLLVCFGLSLLLIHASFSKALARDITFCGEIIPANNNFVAHKLMNVIRQQIRYVNLPRLRSEARTYFPIIEYYLKAAGMPQDLKYIPIIESGFRNATSPVGAQGFWQLMKPTAEEWGLRVNASRDERNDIYKATVAALKELARNYNMIQRHHKVSSWVLTAASYNYGTGRLYSKIRTEGKNYFSMNLNPETALYVYKIIAIKELFEYPELYIKNFQFNVFNSKADGKNTSQQGLTTDEKAVVQNLQMKVDESGKAPPDSATIGNLQKPDESDLKIKNEDAFKKAARLVSAEITGRYKDFQDGGEITIELQEALQTQSGLKRKGSSITGKGWLIDGRIHIDLGFNSNNVILYDTNSEQGIGQSSLKKGEQVILRVQN